MEKLSENMIRWAESKLGSTEYAGWCLAFKKKINQIKRAVAFFGILRLISKTGAAPERKQQCCLRESAELFPRKTIANL